MSFIRILCPHCQTGQNVEDNRGGKPIACVNCRRVFVSASPFNRFASDDLDPWINERQKNIKLVHSQSFGPPPTPELTSRPEPQPPTLMERYTKRLRGTTEFMFSTGFPIAAGVMIAGAVWWILSWMASLVPESTPVAAAPEKSKVIIHALDAPDPSEYRIDYGSSQPVARSDDPSMTPEEATELIMSTLMSTPEGRAKIEEIGGKDAELTRFQRDYGISDRIAEAAVKAWGMQRNRGLILNWDLEEVKQLCLRFQATGIPVEYLPEAEKRSYRD